MGSSGIITRRSFMPITSQGEYQRQEEAMASAFPGMLEGARREHGTIREIHPTKPRLIKAYSDDGAPLANNKWIELNHSAQEIAERWGTVRIGFRVRVIYAGPSGAGADATIIGAEGQNVTDPIVENEAAQGLYLIFPPGIG